MIETKMYPTHKNGVQLGTGAPGFFGPAPGWFAYLNDHHSTLWCNSADDAKSRAREAFDEAARWFRVADAIDAVDAAGDEN